MLSTLVVESRVEIIARCRARAAAQQDPDLPTAASGDGIPRFLEHLAATLAGQRADDLAIGAAATEHGAELLRRGVSVGHVVHDYGNACQAITELAIERGLAITAQDFTTLNRCLEASIADAVTEYTRQRELELAAEGARRELEELGLFGHELRDLLATATLAFEALRSGRVGIAGTTGGMLGRSLLNLSVLVARSLAAVRLDAEMTAPERIVVGELLVDLQLAAHMQAHARHLQLVVEPHERSAAVLADRQILGSVIANLMQNAIKYTRPHSRVILRTAADATRVRIEVEDQCGGLPPGKVEHLFEPFQRRSQDRSGLGLGLVICARGVRASGGTIAVRDLPGTGCVFAVDLPRMA